VVRGARRTLDPGETLEIRVYFCGWGAPDWTKLSFFPPPELFDPTYRYPEDRPLGDPGCGPLAVETQAKAMGASAHDRSRPAKPDVTYEWAYRKPESTGFPVTGGMIGILPSAFFPLLDLTGGSIDVDNFVVNKGRKDRLTVSEAEMVDRAGFHGPLVIRGKVNGAATGGDYTIPLVFTYAHESKVQSSAAELEVHIRPWWERPSYQALLAASGLIVVGASFVALVPWFASVVRALGGP
jgi:hypothetical protein